MIRIADGESVKSRRWECVCVKCERGRQSAHLLSAC